MYLKRNSRSKKSLLNEIKLIFLLSTVLILFDLFISGIIIRNIKKQNIQNFKSVVQLYIQQQDESFFKLSRQMLSILVGNTSAKISIEELMGTLEESEDPLEINITKFNLKTNFLEYTWDYGANYQFFVYLSKNNTFVDLNSNGNSLPEIEKILIQLIENHELDFYSAKAKWTYFSCSSGNYIMKVMYHQERYLGCYIEVNSLLEPLQEMNELVDGFAILVDEKENIISAETNSQDKQVIHYYFNQEKKEAIKNYFVVEQDFSYAPFTVLLFASNHGLYQKIGGIQISLIVLGATILAILFFINHSLQKSILQPIQVFVDNLTKSNDSNQFLFNISNNQLKELEQANSQFRHLLKQIKKLKITLYENELNKQKIQMDYLQLQIKPHFYLNCLNFIYQMVDLENYEEAKHMAVYTSNYLRYLFKSGMDFVSIESELQHVNDYLQIQKMRYQNAFNFYIEQEEETLTCTLPPLMIQTFVENSVKHTVSLDHPVEITIFVSEEIIHNERYINISISDTGNGFPDEILQKLQNHQILEQSEEGHRIGITNCIKRMHYFYQDKGRFDFYNSPMGGAIVEIHLPAAPIE